MGLVKLTRPNGQPIWINPHNVAYLAPTNGSQVNTLIGLVGGNESEIHVQGDPQHIARLLGGELPTES